MCSLPAWRPRLRSRTRRLIQDAKRGESTSRPDRRRACGRSQPARSARRTESSDEPDAHFRRLGRTLRGEPRRSCSRHGQEPEEPREAAAAALRRTRSSHDHFHRRSGVGRGKHQRPETVELSRYMATLRQILDFAGDRASAYARRRTIRAGRASDRAGATKAAPGAGISRSPRCRDRYRRWSSPRDGPDPSPAGKGSSLTCGRTSLPAKPADWALAFC